eukprot:CAMPEP_0180117748 /NCGR_PEP_ID=MMETSP0986-20121125/1087_1 /TAXON_ID=697907 /ORGANISM="non described non described, Strain CCMP2293" /LENGTH=225 /DNA_ID=CAMNT_0022056649 /DNA_START=113 /DNA_END=788 /DNA_ORIENTATION=-
MAATVRPSRVLLLSLASFLAGAQRTLSFTSPPPHPFLSRAAPSIAPPSHVSAKWAPPPALRHAIQSVSSATHASSAASPVVEASAGAGAMAGGSVRRIEDGALAEDGIAAIRVDPAAVAEAMALYEALVSPEGGDGGVQEKRSHKSAQVAGVSAAEPRVDRGGPGADGGVRVPDPGQDGLDYDIYTTGWTPTMRWVAAGGEETLDRMKGNLGGQIQQALEGALGE